MATSSRSSPAIRLCAHVLVGVRADLGQVLAGNRSGLVLPRSTQPASSQSVTWLLSTIVPESQVPGGKQTVPPPAAAQASMAFWMAAVESVCAVAPGAVVDEYHGTARRPARRPRAGARRWATCMRVG